MRPQRPISEQAKESLRELLAKTKNKADFQRVQCVWLRILLGLSSIMVAKAVGCSPGRVKQVWSRYFADGESALVGKGRGGRRRQNLSIEEEDRLLAGFLESAKMGLRYEAASEDGGRPSGVGIQVLIPNRLKLLWSKAMVVSV